MTKEESIRLVTKLLTKGNEIDNTDLIVNETKILDADTHWIVPVQSKKYIETGDTAYAVIGINPYAIIKATKKIDHDFEGSDFIYLEEKKKF